MELKIVVDEESQQELKMPPIDRQKEELNAWKMLAVARGVMLDPYVFLGSRTYQDALFEARVAIRILKDLEVI